MNSIVCAVMDAHPVNTILTTRTATGRVTATTTTTTQDRLRADAGPTMHLRIVPKIDDPSRPVIFHVFESDLHTGEVIKLGRNTSGEVAKNTMVFKNKVVSRSHCEIWMEKDGKLYLRDTKSSSGTFLNSARLSPANEPSRPREINDGDVIQLGVDYQGGREPIYRAVKMRLELNRQPPRETEHSRKAFQNLTHDHDMEGCCICLCSILPTQALFYAPCSHMFHFKCIQPIVIPSYPGFQCPLCRTYADLEESVETEVASPTSMLAVENTHDSDDLASSHCSSLSSSDNESDTQPFSEVLSTTLTNAQQQERTNVSDDVSAAVPGRRRSAVVFVDKIRILAFGEKRDRRAMTSDTSPEASSPSSAPRLTQPWSPQ